MIDIKKGGYSWNRQGPSDAHQFVLPQLIKKIKTLYHGKPIKIIDLGCGNGYVASKLAQLGHRVTGVDGSREGIELARKAYPDIEFFVQSIYENTLPNQSKGLVDCLISIEVVEHLFAPQRFFNNCFRLLKPGGFLIVSTPYHGYFKNLVISLLGGWDHHFKVGWEGGHIKFFSRKTLSQMAIKSGFKKPRIQGVGRLPWLWKSMIMVVEK